MLAPIPMARLGHAVALAGFAMLSDQDVSTEALLGLARALGKPRPDAPHRPLVRALRPSEARYSRPNTLSSRHGVGAFPVHTEAAYWKTPPRYLVLACAHPGAGSRPTLLVDLHGAIGLRPTLAARLRRARWLVDARPRFFANVIAPSADGGVRFDAACMHPCDSSAEMAADELRAALDAAPRITMNWRPGDVLVVDNWRFAHGRGATSVADPNRVLMRVLVEATR